MHAFERICVQIETGTKKEQQRVPPITCEADLLLRFWYLDQEVTHVRGGGPSHVPFARDDEDVFRVFICRSTMPSVVK
jgi:hypothetical protein